MKKKDRPAKRQDRTGGQTHIQADKHHCILLVSVWLQVRTVNILPKLSPNSLANAWWIKKKFHLICRGQININTAEPSFAFDVLLQSFGLVQVLKYVTLLKRMSSIKCVSNANLKWWRFCRMLTIYDWTSGFLGFLSRPLNEKLHLH